MYGFYASLVFYNDAWKLLQIVILINTKYCSISILEITVHNLLHRKLIFCFKVTFLIGIWHANANVRLANVWKIDFFEQAFAKLSV